MANLTVYNDLILPATYVMASGLSGKIRRRNLRTQSPSGKVAVAVLQSRSYREYEFGAVPMSFERWQTLEGLFEVTDAGAAGFLLEDPKDVIVAVGAGFMAPFTTELVGSIGTGYGVPVFKLYKRYQALGVSSRTKDRSVTRPQSGASLYRGGVAVTIGASPGNAAINYDTGTVTFVADESQALTSITAGGSTVLNFANGTGMVAAMSVGQRVYLLGLSGTAASRLNGLSHAITAKGATSLTVSTSTSGLAATGGTAYKYPQASEAMTWTGRMYVPVHFQNDEIDWSLLRPAPNVAGRLFSGPSVVLSEVPE